MFGRSKLISTHSLHGHEDETLGISVQGEAFCHKHPVYSMVMGLWYPICLKTL